MKHLLKLLLVLTILSQSCRPVFAGNAVITILDGQMNPLANENCVLSYFGAPHSMAGGSAVQWRTTATSGTNGVITLTNAAPGGWQVKPMDMNTVAFTFLMPVTNGTIYVQSWTTASAGNTLPPDTMSFGCNASDLRYDFSGLAAQEYTNLTIWALTNFDLAGSGPAAAAQVISTGQAATFGSLTATGSVSVSGNVAVVGTNSAAYFAGNGGSLTGLNYSNISNSPTLYNGQTATNSFDPTNSAAIVLAAMVSSNYVPTTTNYVAIGTANPGTVLGIKTINANAGLNGDYLPYWPTVITNIYGSGEMVFKQSGGTNYLMTNPYGAENGAWLFTATTNTSGGAYYNGAFWQGQAANSSQANPCWFGQFGQPAWTANPSGNQSALVGTAPPVCFFNTYTNSVTAPAATFGTVYAGNLTGNASNLVNVTISGQQTAYGVAQVGINLGTNYSMELNIAGATNVALSGQAQWGALMKPCFNILMIGALTNSPGATETGIVQCVQAIETLPSWSHLTNWFQPIVEIQQGMFMRRSSTGQLQWNTNQYPSGPSFIPNFLHTNGFTLNPIYDFYCTSWGHIPPGASGVCMNTIGGSSTNYIYTNTSGTITPSFLTNLTSYSDLTLPETMLADAKFLQTNGWNFGEADLPAQQLAPLAAQIQIQCEQEIALAVQKCITQSNDQPMIIMDFDTSAFNNLYPYGSQTAQFHNIFSCDQGPGINGDATMMVHGQAFAGTQFFYQGGYNDGSQYGAVSSANGPAYLITCAMTGEFPTTPMNAYSPYTINYVTNNLLLTTYGTNDLWQMVEADPLQAEPVPWIVNGGSGGYNTNDNWSIWYRNLSGNRFALAAFNNTSSTTNFTLTQFPPIANPAFNYQISNCVLQTSCGIWTNGQTFSITNMTAPGTASQSQMFLFIPTLL